MDIFNLFSLRNTDSIFFDAARGHSQPARKNLDKFPALMVLAVTLPFFSIQYSNAEPIPRTQVKSFDAPGASQTMPEDINNSLTVIGRAYHSDNTNTSFVYRNGIRETTAPGYFYSGNNNQGQIVGTQSHQTPGQSSFSTAFIKTGDEFASPSSPSAATDINDQGTLIGSYGGHVYIFKDDEPTFFLEDWEDIDPRDEGGIHGATAYSINNNDVVVGSYIVNGGGDGREHGFIYDHKKSSYETLYHPSLQSTRPRGINNWGLVVGNHYPGDETSQGFAYFDGKFIPVEVGTRSTTVDGVNDWGFITGSYWDIGGDKEHAYVAHILPFIFWDQIN